MKYVVFGSGGFAKEVIDYIESDGHQVVAVVSTQPFNHVEYARKYEILDQLKKDQFPEAEFILAVADSEVKKKIVSKNEDRWGNFIHSTCHVSSYAKLGKGIILCPFSSILGDSVIGNFVTLNIYCSVAHDCQIGSYATFSPYSATMGNCSIGDECFFGAAAYCIPKIKLHDKIKVSAGSTVRHSYDVECTLRGNPAKPKL